MKYRKANENKTGRAAKLKGEVKKLAVYRDKFGRKIEYLRISITDRCNLRCRYCMPPEGVEYKPHESILRYEEIIRIVRVGIELGIKRVRITGGEPLVRQGVVGFIKELAGLEGLEDISMTTNATLLAGKAAGLKRAGLRRVNISLDSLRRDRYREITGRDSLDQALAGIKSALRVGLSPVKLNVVVMRGINDDEIPDLVELTLDYPLHVRFIEYMPLGRTVQSQLNSYISLEEIKRRIGGRMELIPGKVKGNGPAEYFKVPAARGTIGFITPVSHSFCTRCNRLRLTADGRLRPCLVDNIEVDLHDGEGRVEDSEDIRRKFKEAILLKPGSHNFFQEDIFSERNMFQIGG